MTAYLELADYLLIAERVLELPAEAVEFTVTVERAASRGEVPPVTVAPCPRCAMPYAFFDKPDGSWLACVVAIDSFAIRAVGAS